MSRFCGIFSTPKSASIVYLKSKAIENLASEGLKNRSNLRFAIQTKAVFCTLAKTMQKVCTFFGLEGRAGVIRPLRIRGLARFEFFHSVTV